MDKNIKNRSFAKSAAALLAVLLLFAFGVTAYAAQTLKGDVSLNGAVTAEDARLALRQAVGLENLEPRRLYAAAVTGRGAVTAEDARIILRMALDLTTYEREREKAVEQTLSGMSTRVKLEQMLMPDVREYNGAPQETLHADVAAMLKKHAFGGVILFAPNTKTAEQTLRLTDALQTANAKEGRTQLLIGADQEGGEITRLATGTQTPGNMALGAIGEAQAARTAAGIIGEELKAVGINVDFAPVMDINNEPANPVIGVRSFSDRAATVEACGAGYVSGLQDGNVIAAMKHFPGHGDTNTDSHTGLPVVNKNLAALEKQELRPFAAGIAEGAEMVMTAHIRYPQIETKTYVSKSTGEKITLPATLSETVLTGLLREKMGFEGVVITDAMHMEAITKHFDPLDAAALAVNAGADILLIPFYMHSPTEIAAADAFIDRLAALAEKGTVSGDKIDAAVRRILRLKYDKGLFYGYALPEGALQNAKKTVGSTVHHEAEWLLAKRAVTMVKNEKNTLPMKAENKKTVLLAMYPNELLSLRYGVKRAMLAGALPENAEIVYGCYTNTAQADLTDMIRNADYVLAIHELYRESALDPRTGSGANGAVLDRLIRETHAHGGRFILLSAHLPYDAARFQAADAILLCWNDKGMSEDPRVKNGDVTQYGPNIPAAIYTALCAADGPQGRLPVDIPALTSNYTYSDTALYPFGYGLRY